MHKGQDQVNFVEVNSHQKLILVLIPHIQPGNRK